MIPSSEQHKAALDAAFLTLPMNNRSYRETVEKAISAYLSALPEQTGERWQPIETCPSDGKPILVIGGRHEEAHIVPADGDYWRSEYCPKGFRPAAPTHWMPLPAPPAGESP